MKRIFALAAVCLLLCGCAKEPQPETIPTETQPLQVSPTEPEGYYDPASALEEQTKGAVRVYPLDMADAYAFACMGEDILVFSGTGDTTTLTVLSGESLYPAASVQISCALYPENDTVQVSEKGISYFDSHRKETVILDDALKEISCIAAPEGLSGCPILSPDRKTLYYCTADSIRALDTATGISKLLKEMSYPSQSITAVLMDGAILRCSIYDEANNYITLYLSSQTGETLYVGSDSLQLDAPSDWYYATITSGAVRTLVFGSGEAEQAALTPAELDAQCRPLPRMRGAVTISYPGDGTTALDYYDLQTGLRSSSLTLEEENSLWYMDAASGRIYFMAYSDRYCAPVIYRWEPDKLPSGDTALYTGPHYKLDSPDTEGLARCQAQADVIGEKYGLNILTGFYATAVQPWDYYLETEYLVKVTEQELSRLDEALSAYPTGFLQALAEPGSIHICLVRQLTGTPESGSLESASGIQFWEGTDTYIALAAGDTSGQTLYHELFHVIESRVMSVCSAYDDWSKLNPEGFEYDYSYQENTDRDASMYLLEESRAFIDTYSMSYPKEDRARIMEYAMLPGNEALFQSKTMQNKLRQLSLGIRQAFDLEEVPEVFPWEQYLNEPLAPQA